jgi:hypothetical protein
MPEKLLSCVKAVKAKGGPSSKYAWPICIKSTGLHPHKRKLKKQTKRRYK